jgi:mannose-6-phosphate isomerase-like protein (cupin superfamily)
MKKGGAMRTLCLSFLTIFALAAPVVAQTAAPQSSAPMMKAFTSSAEVQALIAKAKADRKGDAPTTVEPILSLAPYHANLEYRPIPGPAAVHDVEDEVMYVIEGSGTITLGGQMVNPTRPNPTNQSADKISGGDDHKLAKGDFLIVPHGLAHQITAVDSPALVLMTLHMPQ